MSRRAVQTTGQQIDERTRSALPFVQSLERCVDPRVARGELIDSFEILDRAIRIVGKILGSHRCLSQKIELSRLLRLPIERPVIELKQLVPASGCVEGELEAVERPTRSG